MYLAYILARTNRFLSHMGLCTHSRWGEVLREHWGLWRCGHMHREVGAELCMKYSMSSVGSIIWSWGEGTRSWEWAGTGGCWLERERKMEGGRRNRESGQKSGGGECMSGQGGVDRFQARHFQTDWMAKVKGSHFLWKRGCLKCASSVCWLDAFGTRSRMHVQTDGAVCMQSQPWKQVLQDFWNEWCIT